MRLAWLAAAAVSLASPVALAAPSFRAALDRPAVAPEQPFIYQVTLSNAEGRAGDFKGPDFRGLKVLQGPITQEQSGVNIVIGGGMQMQSTISWTYQLMVPQGARGPISIGPAHVLVGGQQLTSNAVSVRIGAPAAGAPSPSGTPRPQGPPRLFPRGADDDAGEGEPTASSSRAPFLRAATDKKRAYVGELVTATWSLHVPQPAKFAPTALPKADGFWTEEVASTNPPGQLVWTDEDEGGQPYKVAIVLQRALFPLAPGKLTVTRMEADTAMRFDFFGRALDFTHLKSEPLTVEAIPLPREGQPPHFPAANVGQFTLEVAVDRATVAVGDAVTLTVTVRGTGNLRNVTMPDLPTLPGWQSYEPKTTVALDGSATASGSKTLEWLIRPERPGKTTIDGLTLVSFDPATRRYVESHGNPIYLEVSGDAGVAAVGGQPTTAATSAPGVGDASGAEIRPIRARAAPARSIGASFLHSAGFTLTLLAPPLALLGFGLAGRVRDRLSRDERRTSRRRLRSIARRRLRAAAAHRDAGRASAFYVEIERVLRETLSEKLRVPVAGLRTDELEALLVVRGLPADEAARLLAVLAACDEARFSPGGEPAERPAQDEMLERAAALIDVVEKAPLAAGGAA